MAKTTIPSELIADDAVTLDKMVGLARGKIIYGDSSGNPAALALGSNGQILKSDGTDISWGAESTFDTDAAQVFNESGAAVDFRIEGDSEQNLFFVDGSADKIGIGSNSPANKLDIVDSTAGFGVRITNNQDSSQGLQVRTSDNDTGLYILDLQTSTSATGTNYSSQFVVEKAGNVGLGTTSPKALSGQKSLSINASVPRIDFKVGDVFKHHILAEAEYMSIGADADNNQSNSRVIIEADNAVVARFDSDGIKFGADTAAANALDDYEEGTWTPDLRSGTTSLSTQTWAYGPTATYTKIGRMVYIHMSGKLSSVAGTGASELRVYGLPFTPESTGGYQEYRVNFALGNQPNTSDHSLFGFIRNAGQDIGTRILDGGDSQFHTNRIDSDTFMSFWGAYFTDS